MTLGQPLVICEFARLGGHPWSPVIYENRAPFVLVLLYKATESRIKHYFSQVAFADMYYLTYGQYLKDIIEGLYAFYSNLREH
jgi:hypothetical protein